MVILIWFKAEELIAGLIQELVGKSCSLIHLHLNISTYRIHFGHVGSGLVL